MQTIFGAFQIKSFNMTMAKLTFWLHFKLKWKTEEKARRKLKPNSLFFFSFQFVLILFHANMKNLQMSTYFLMVLFTCWHFRFFFSSSFNWKPHWRNRASYKHMYRTIFHEPKCLHIERICKVFAHLEKFVGTSSFNNKTLHENLH